VDSAFKAVLFQTVKAGNESEELDARELFIEERPVRDEADYPLRLGRIERQVASIYDDSPALGPRKPKSSPEGISSEMLLTATRSLNFLVRLTSSIMPSLLLQI
jgi:hypothetical protein